jgi:hypothetical protein
MKRTVYEAPRTEHFLVEIEGCFMATSAVGEKAVLGEENVTIEVEDYDRFDNDITFE